MKTRGGKIAHYQVVTPTCWNGSPRDDQHKPCPIKKTLRRTPVNDSTQPVEVRRVTSGSRADTLCPRRRHRSLGGRKDGQDIGRTGAGPCGVVDVRVGAAGGGCTRRARQGRARAPDRRALVAGGGQSDGSQVRRGQAGAGRFRRLAGGRRLLAALVLPAQHDRRRPERPHAILLPMARQTPHGPELDADGHCDGGGPVARRDPRRPPGPTRRQNRRHVSPVLRRLGQHLPRYQCRRQDLHPRHWPQRQDRPVQRGPQRQHAGHHAPAPRRPMVRLLHVPPEQPGYGLPANHSGLHDLDGFDGRRLRRTGDYRAVLRRVPPRREAHRQRLLPLPHPVLWQSHRRQRPQARRAQDQRLPQYRTPFRSHTPQAPQRQRDA
ncbi:MAG: nickel-dependent hydrogenase large subunit [Sedimentisphaerales bacterium]|nr:nickel-dependent hydrogenase large subunit [Sedimentisphaerales bacterium]